MISWNWVKLKYIGSEGIITVVGKCQKMTKILNLINIYYVENYALISKYFPATTTSTFETAIETTTDSNINTTDDPFQQKLKL